MVETTQLIGEMDEYIYQNLLTALKHDFNCIKAFSNEQLVKSEHSNPLLMYHHEVLSIYFDQLLDMDGQVLMLGERNKNFFCKGNTSCLPATEQIFDAAYPETSLLSVGITAAISGLKPIVELQNMDQLMQAFTTLSDELSALRYPTSGKQSAPLIIRILSSSTGTYSSLGAVLQALRGIDVLVPRDVRRAIGFYNTILKTEDVAIIIEDFKNPAETLTMPVDMEDFTAPLGEPEILLKGTDITLITYGTACEIAVEAARHLHASGVSCEVMDVQSLLPFDMQHSIAASVRKTKRIVLVDEDPLGGVASYLLRQLKEEQGIYHYLESQPGIVTADADAPILHAQLLADQISTLTDKF